MLTDNEDDNQKINFITVKINSNWSILYLALKISCD